MELESLIGGRQATEAWRFIRSIKKEPKGTLNCMTTLGEWEKHCSELLTENRPEYKVMATPPPREDNNKGRGKGSS
jgi:hypothetical protein